MATCTHAIGTANTAVGPLASGAFTPAAGDLLVVFVVASDTTDGTANAVVTNSLGLTFTKVRACGWHTSADALWCFVANEPAVASSQTCTITMSGDNSTGTIIFVTRVAGMKRLGQAAVRQTAIQANQSSGIPAPAFSEAALTANPTLGLVGTLASPAGMTPPVGWTEGATADLGYSTPTTGGEAVTRDSGFTGTTITWGSSTPVAFGALIVELEASDPVRLTMPPMGATR